MRRTAGDEEIDRHDRRGAVVHLGVADERPAGDRAGADGDHDLRRRHGVVGLLQRQFHVLRHRAGDEQPVGVARRGHELDAEAAEIPADRAEHVGVGLAGVAAAGAHLPQPQRAAEELAQLLVERGGEADLLLARRRRARGPRARRTAMRWSPVCVMAPGRARLDARGAEDAAAEIERDRLPGRRA